VKLIKDLESVEEQVHLSSDIGENALARWARQRQTELV